MAAIVGTLVLCVAGAIVITARADGFDSTPNSLTYRNDTDQEVWIYECYGRCEDYGWGFWVGPGEDESLMLDWYWEEIEWVIVAKEDSSYGCIHIPNWEDQSVWISTASKCPKDIHSPEFNIA
jgi:hypothetical protein